MNKIIIIVVALVIVGLVAYFVLFSPTATKSNIEKPTGLIVNETHVAWLINELGSYKLHNNRVNGEIPEIEIICSKTYNAVINNGFPTVKEGSAINPDVRITTTDQYILELLNTTNILQNAYQMQKDGKLAIGMLKPQEDLALKGYIALYNEMTGSFFLK